MRTNRERVSQRMKDLDELGIVSIQGVIEALNLCLGEQDLCAQH